MVGESRKGGREFPAPVTFTKQSFASLGFVFPSDGFSNPSLQRDSCGIVMENIMALTNEIDTFSEAWNRTPHGAENRTLSKVSDR